MTCYLYILQNDHHNSLVNINLHIMFTHENVGGELGEFP